MREDKVYLGDAVYVRWDGYSLWLTTEYGLSTTNEICLEPEVYGALLRFVALLSVPRREEPK